MTEDRMRALVAEVSYKDGYQLVLDKGDDGRPYLQVTFWRADIVTGKDELGWSGKRFVSPHMSESEFIRACFGTFLALEEHECREWFQIDLGEGSRRVFGPHVDVDALYEVALRVDLREAP